MILHMKLCSRITPITKNWGYLGLFKYMTVPQTCPKLLSFGDGCMTDQFTHNFLLMPQTNNEVLLMSSIDTSSKEQGICIISVFNDQITCAIYYITSVGPWLIKRPVIYALKSYSLLLCFPHIYAYTIC